MKKIYIYIFISLFLTLIPHANAKFGDVNYQINNVVVTDSEIKFEGYAFIHRTNNFRTVKTRDSSGRVGNVIASEGGQEVKIILTDGTNTLEVVKDCIDEDYGYNFYYPMFYQKIAFGMDVYNDIAKNQCRGTGNDSSTEESQCYYEDLGFSISFSIAEIIQKFNSGDNLSFYISVSNKHYREKFKEANGYDTYWTPKVALKISDPVQNSERIKIIGGQPNGEAKFIAEQAVFQNHNELSTYKKEDTCYINGAYHKKTVYAVGRSLNSGNYYYYNIFNSSIGGYDNGRYIYQTNSKGVRSFLNGTKEEKYLVCMKPEDNPSNSCVDIGKNACASTKNGYCTRCSEGAVLAAVYGSWVTFENTNQLIIQINNSGCTPNPPSNGKLQCNNNKTFNSTCDTLIVEGKKVKIEQTGIISSVLTPDKIYAGGGFNFGVMYYNNVKWSYVDTKPNEDLHKKIKSEMEEKIKGYDPYIAGLNISNLKLDGKEPTGFSSLNKKCTTSSKTSNDKDYFGDGITVSCVFSFPESILHYNGDVEYKIGTGTINVNNKYYTPIDFSGYYTLSAEIEGMSRITEGSATQDSNNGSPWIGKWSDTFNCGINLYSLLLKNNGKYNFIYRPIDINNPFPNNRIAGINWYDWISVTTNQDRIKNTYKNSDEYYASFDNKTISEIKKYNKNHNYLNWDNINENGNSSFITDNNYINKGGGNQ